MKIGRCFLLCFAILVAGFTTVVYANPKVPVQVRIEEEITNLSTEGDLSFSTGGRRDSYYNVIVTPEVPVPDLRNNGKWCLRTQGELIHLVKSGTYKATMDGDYVEMQVAQPKGAPLKVTFTVFDRKWRSRLDIRGK